MFMVGRFNDFDQPLGIAMTFLLHRHHDVTEELEIKRLV